MTMIEFINSLPEWEGVALCALLVMCVWACIAPYFSLLHLKGIEQKLNRIADELARQMEHGERR